MLHNCHAPQSSAYRTFHSARILRQIKRLPSLSNASSSFAISKQLDKSSAYRKRQSESCVNDNGACKRVSFIQGSSLKQHAPGIPNAEDVLRTQVGSNTSISLHTSKKRTGRQSDMCHIKAFLLGEPRNEMFFRFLTRGRYLLAQKGIW